MLLTLLSTKAIASECFIPLPGTIRGVVPAYAVDKENYPKYTVSNKDFNIAILPGNAGKGSFATGIIAETLVDTDYDILIGTSSGGLTTLFSMQMTDKHLLILLSV